MLQEKRRDCLLLDAIERYNSAIQLTSPTAYTQKSHVIVSEFPLTGLSSSGLVYPLYFVVQLNSWTTLVK